MIVKTKARVNDGGKISFEIVLDTLGQRWHGMFEEFRMTQFELQAIDLRHSLLIQMGRV